MQTPVDNLEVTKGDTIDLITDCRSNYTSDSFAWRARITMRTEGQPERTIASDDHFHGPTESIDVIPGRIARAWELACCRKPTSEELSLAVKFVADQIQMMDNEPGAIPKGRTRVRQIMTNLCQTLLSSNEFLYVE